MTQGLVTDTYMSDLADAIRAKLGTEDTYTPAEMADAILSIGGGSVEIVPWSSGTDEQIAAMIDAAHNGDIDLQTDGGWSVGDVRTITLSSFTGVTKSIPAQTARIVISSFDEYESCGNLLQFDFKDSLTDASRDQMNTSSTNTGGYESSGMNTELLTNMVDALPSWIQDRLVGFTVDEGTDTKKLALRSLSEVGLGASGTIDYYETAGNRIKTLGENGNAFYWWLRNKYNNDSKSFYQVNSSGSSSYESANNLRGVSPFGCL